MGNTIILEEVSSLQDCTINGLKNGTESGIINLAGGLHNVNYKQYLFGNSCFIHKKVGLYDHQETVLRKVTEENNAILTDTLQALEKLPKTDKDIETKTEEFKGEPTSPLYWKQPKVIKKPTLIYLVTIQEQISSNRYPQGYVRADWIPVEMLDLRRFKEAIGS